MKDRSDFQEFKKQLTDHYSFPTFYLFKFIIPADKKTAFQDLFPEWHFDIKQSKTGKYISFSKKLKVNSSEEVIEVYTRAYSIEGIISL